MTNNVSNLDGSKLDLALLEIKNSHKCVESIEEIPKLKLDDMCINKDFQITSYLQEFQYGNNVFQTTTNKYQDTYLIYVGSCIIMMRMVNSLFVWLW